MGLRFGWVLPPFINDTFPSKLGVFEVQEKCYVQAGDVQLTDHLRDVGALRERSPRQEAKAAKKSETKKPRMAWTLFPYPRHPRNPRSKLCA
jgi:hypothetical protein